MTTPHGRRIGLGVAAIGTALILGSGLFYWEEIRLEWCCRKVTWEILAGAPDEEKPTPAFKALLDAGEAGYPFLARLLRDPRYEVWNFTAMTLDHSPGYEPHPILEYIRDRDRLAYLQFLYLDVHDEGSWWRVDGFCINHRSREYSDSKWYEYWSSRKGERLEPFTEGVDLLESFILDRTRFPQGHDPRSRTHDKIRAIHALGAMLQPGESERPRTPLAERIRKILVASAMKDPDPEVRLDAVYRLILCSKEFSSAGSGDGFGVGQLELFDSLDAWLSPAKKEKIPQTWDILALRAFHHPLGLRILRRFLKDPALRPWIQSALGRSAPLGSLEMPDWSRPRESARRFLKGDALERIHAAAYLAEEDCREEIPVLQEALAAEQDGQVRTNLQACLLALGDDSQREFVRTSFAHLLQDPQMVGPVRPMVSPAEIFGWLILSGDREVLSTEQDFSHPNSSGLYGGLEAPVESYIDGLPEEFRPKDLQDYWRTTWSEEEAVWWRANQDRITWDTARRRFMVLQSAQVR